VRLKAPNGKVDRRALAAHSIKPELEGILGSPHLYRRKIAEIWAQVLELEQVGIYDNFFELGGDSILSIQIIARANQAGLQLQLFENRPLPGWQQSRVQPNHPS